MLIVGETTPEYPFGYGRCQCGCEKITKVISGIHLKFFKSSHNPKFRKKILAPRQSKQLDARELKRRQARQVLTNPTPPQIKQPTLTAIAKEGKNERLARTVAWTKVNQDFIKWHRKKLRAKSNEIGKHYQRERRKRDPIFKLLAYVRGRIRGALISKNLRKTIKAEQLLGCSVQELKNHLEVQFKNGMTWDKYGQWHVDHIKPCCSFDLTKIEEQKICFHYTNLQPLWAEENLKKNGRYEPKSENLA